jgi:hypothetical protein
LLLKVVLVSVSFGVSIIGQKSKERNSSLLSLKKRSLLQKLKKKCGGDMYHQKTKKRRDIPTPPKKKEIRNVPAYYIYRVL